MPIPLELLSRALVPLVFTPSDTVEKLLYLFAEQSAPHHCYAIVRVTAEQYAVVALNDLREVANQHDPALLSLPLGGIPRLLRAGAPLWQSKTRKDRALRELDERTHYRRVILDDDNAIIGVLVATELGTPKGISPLTLIGVTKKGTLEPAAETLPIAPAHVNTRFDGLAPNGTLLVGRRVPLIVSIGQPAITTLGQNSRPFTFDFVGGDAPVRFLVRVQADPEMWVIRIHEPMLIVAPPGITQQEAEFTVIARQPGHDKLHLSIERADTGGVVQHMWLPVVAAAEEALHTPPAAAARVEISLPLDIPQVVRPAVEFVVQSGRESSVLIVNAKLPPDDRLIHERYILPVSSVAVQNATLRLRQELEKVVFYPGRGDNAEHPFIDPDNLTVDETTARRACVPLADAGRQVWDMLFNAPRANEQLKQLAIELRSLPEGSHIRIVLDSQECIVPWALLYDRPGQINEKTLTWSGFWGYRYIMDTLPPGRYPASSIAEPQPGLLLLLNDDAELHDFTSSQEQFVRDMLGGAAFTVAWGHTQVQQVLQLPLKLALVYGYCHGDHESGVVAPGALTGDSALLFSRQQRLRLTDLRYLPPAPFTSRPLVFLNACEGATQYPFYYDGFMPFFIEQQLARGFIGTEVKTPVLLAHDFALHFLRMFGQGKPVGESLWRLRRHYIDIHHTILAFNYSLYCPGDVRLATPLANSNKI
jgi:hypothetical protein